MAMHSQERTAQCGGLGRVLRGGMWPDQPRRLPTGALIGLAFVRRKLKPLRVRGVLQGAPLQAPPQSRNGATWHQSPKIRLSSITLRSNWSQARARRAACQAGVALGRFCSVVLCNYSGAGCEGSLVAMHAAMVRGGVYVFLKTSTPPLKLWLRLSSQAGVLRVGCMGG